MNNLYLIIGEDSKLVNFQLDGILKQITFSLDDKISYDMSSFSLNDILDEASMISLFSNIKIIIGNNFDVSKVSEGELEYLNKYIDNINKNVYIILISSKVDARVKAYKIIRDAFKIIDTTKLNNKEYLYEYVKNILSNRKYEMDEDTIWYFINRTLDDINNINLELEKLFIYKEKDKCILKKDIDLLVFENIDNVIYEFTNAVIDDDIDKTVKMYNDFKRENISREYLITSLSNVFRQSLIIKIMHNEGKNNIEIAKVIGKKEFYVKKMIERLYRYTENDLCSFINKLAKIDFEDKSGKSNSDMLELFLIDKER